MELAYLSDPMARFSAVNCYPTWEEINYTDKYSRTQRFACKETKTSEKNCSICQQKKKRILSDYIKTNCRKTTSIQEEDEEAEEKASNQKDEKK